MLRDEISRYQQITGESAEHVPIIKLGAFLDGYDMAIKTVEEMIKAEMPERGMWEIEGDKEKEIVCEVCVDLLQKLFDLPAEQKTNYKAFAEHEDPFE